MLCLFVSLDHTQIVKLLPSEKEQKAEQQKTIFTNITSSISSQARGIRGTTVVKTSERASSGGTTSSGGAGSAVDSVVDSVRILVVGDEMVAGKALVSVGKSRKSLPDPDQVPRKNLAHGSVEGYNSAGIKPEKPKAPKAGNTNGEGGDGDEDAFAPMETQLVS